MPDLTVYQWLASLTPSVHLSLSFYPPLFRSVSNRSKKLLQVMLNNGIFPFIPWAFNIRRCYFCLLNIAAAASEVANYKSGVGSGGGLVSPPVKSHKLVALRYKHRFLVRAPNLLVPWTLQLHSLTPCRLIFYRRDCLHVALRFFQ